MPSISPSSRFTMRRLRVGIKSNLLFRFTTTIGRSTSRVSPGDSLLEQLSFPFLQKAVDFYDEFMEFLRVLVGSLLAEFAPAFFFFADHPAHSQTFERTERTLMA